MIIGLGDTQITDPMANPGYSDGLKLWGTPSAAVTALGHVFSNASTSFSSGTLPYTMGILTPPLLVLVLLMSGGSRR